MVKPINSTLDINFKFQSSIEPTIECINFNFNNHIVDGNHTHFQKKHSLLMRNSNNIKIFHQNIRV